MQIASRCSTLLFLLCAFGFPHVARAQSGTKPLKIEPDSPDFTIGTSILPRGHFQAESRTTAQRRGSNHESSFGGTLLRYGVSEHAEIRFGVPAYAVERDNGRMSGLDDSSVEAKVKLYEGKSAEFGLLVDSILPTGSHRIGENHFQPSFRLSSSFKLNDRLQLLANLGARHASAEEKRFTELFAATELDFEVSPTTETYCEIYGFNHLEEGQKSQKFIAAGVIHLLNNRVALDARVGGGLGNGIGGPDYFYELGFSRLF
jgi:hypothetical protein